VVTMTTVLAVVALWLGVPATVFGQGGVAGVVTDPTGAVLPRVTVEAHSPELIERVRTTTTDDAGQYRLENLRPGLYSLTFLLDGWSPFVRANVEVTGSSTATADAQLGIGPFADAVSVTAEAPPIDVYSAKHDVTLGGPLPRPCPAARSSNAVGVVVPGVVPPTNEPVRATATTSFPIHGGRSNEGRLLVDGLNVGSPPAGNSATSYTVDVGNAQDVTFSEAGALGEIETGGLVMNIVPK